MKKKAKTALAAVTASLLLATGLAGTANAKDVWNRGVVYWTYSMATAQGGVFAACADVLIKRWNAEESLRQVGSNISKVIRKRARATAEVLHGELACVQVIGNRC
ncbi:hypothetical protein [Bifidobacterium adolescentis]|uniref:hypothetical protein n=1 Tax=Bifidobacterium adolescentis TaxID=1680 RepID=UPI003BB686E2